MEHYQLEEKREGKLAQKDFHANRKKRVVFGGEGARLLPVSNTFHSLSSFTGLFRAMGLDTSVATKRQTKSS